MEVEKWTLSMEQFEMFSPDTMKPNCCESTAVNLKHAATFFFFFSEPTRGAYFIL